MTISDLEQKLSQDPDSPLFARLAKEYLDQGRVEEAKQLCISGIQLYPSYATAQLVLAQCFYAEQNISRALEYLQEASTLLPDSLHLASLYHRWSGPSLVMETPQKRAGIPNPTAEEAIEPPPVPVADVLTDFTIQEAPTIVDSSETVVPQFTEELRTLDISPTEELPAEVADISESVAESEEPLPPSVIDELEQDEIIEIIVADDKQQEPGLPVEEPEVPEERAAPEQPPLPVVVTTVLPPVEQITEQLQHEPFDDGGRIVTKTLAEIYAAQGAYSEAIITYQLLKTLRPSQSAEYDRRIKELEPKANERPSP